MCSAVQCSARRLSGRFLFLTSQFESSQRSQLDHLTKLLNLTNAPRVLLYTEIDPEVLFPPLRHPLLLPPINIVQTISVALSSTSYTIMPVGLRASVPISKKSIASETPSSASEEARELYIVNEKTSDEGTAAHQHTLSPLF